MTRDPLAGVEIAQRQLDQQIYDALKHRILSRELAPGTVLRIRAIALRLGVSVTPVRDALRQLQADGLVRIRGRGETTVTQLNPEEIDDLFDLRQALEVHAARRAATRISAEELSELDRLLEAAAKTFRGNTYLDYPELIRIDPTFHLAVVRAAGNRRLVAAYEALGAHVQIARVYYTTELRRPQETHAEHLAIAQALRRRDAEAAAGAVAQHIENTRRHISLLLTSQQARKELTTERR